MWWPRVFSPVVAVVAGCAAPDGSVFLGRADADESPATAARRLGPPTYGCPILQSHVDLLVKVSDGGTARPAQQARTAATSPCASV